MKLNFRILGEGKPFIMLHGVFGSSDNWQTIGKELASQYQVILVDLRNHGLSPHSDEFTYASMTNDLLELMDDLLLDQAVIGGHSMGGKVAMHYSTHYPDRVEKLVVVDIAPKYYPPHHTHIFEGFHHIRINQIASRKEAEDQLSEVISDPGVRMFLLKNLTRDENGGFKWKLNLPAIEQNIEKIGEGLTDDQVFNQSTLFISGERSDYITENDQSLLTKHFPSSRLVTIPNAGHWVHADQPKALLEVLKNFLS